MTLVKNWRKMAKKLKTARYWTRGCPSCGFEYPNWFVSCPKCHSSWNESIDADRKRDDLSEKPVLQSKEKTVKIIAQLTEEDVKIKNLTLHFSADGISWFQITMIYDEIGGFFASEIENVPNKSTIIYYLKGIDEKNIEFTEDNDGKFYYYQVSEEIPIEVGNTIESPVSTDISEETTEISTQSEFPSQNREYFEKSSKNEESAVVFSPLNKVKKDVNLKKCPKCDSNIKHDWAICPICGFRFSSF